MRDDRGGEDERGGEERCEFHRISSAHWDGWGLVAGGGRWAERLGSYAVGFGAQARARTLLRFCLQAHIAQRSHASMRSAHLCVGDVILPGVESFFAEQGEAPSLMLRLDRGSARSSRSIHARLCVDADAVGRRGGLFDGAAAKAGADQQREHGGDEQAFMIPASCERVEI